jgi:type I restriction-modification system DNA methylase subunit
MPKLSLAKLERHLYSAADRLRQEGLDAATHNDYIFGMLFLKRSSDVFDAEREKIVGSRIEQGMAQEKAEGYGEDTDYYNGFLVPERARWAYLQDRLGARELQGEQSDVDIMVEVDPSIGVGFVELAEHLERALGIHAELVSR